MRRVFNLCAMLVAVATMATSCFWSGNDEYKSTALVSVVDGDATLGQYVIFESGQKGLVTKGETLIGDIPTTAYYPDKATGEARALIYYSSELIQGDIFFDGKVQIEALKPVDIKLTHMMMPEGNMEQYNDNVTVYSTGVTYTRGKYLNLQFVYPSGGATYDSQHKFELVYNPSKSGFYASAYPEVDNGYLYVELYHDAGNDGGKVGLSERVISFYLDDLMIGRHIETEYHGIRVLYRDNDSPRMVEFKFNK